MNTNKYGDTFSTGDNVKWSETQSERSGVISRWIDDVTVVVLDGPYGHVNIHIDDLYR